MANLFLCNSSNISSDIGDKELLWTNPSPTTAFAAQTIELDLTDYDGVLIKSNFNNSSPTPDDSYSFIVKGTSGKILGASSASPKYSTFRDVEVTDSSITFSTGMENSASANGKCIPCYIWGVKFGGYQTSNKYLRYNEASGYIQAINENGKWVNLYRTEQIPIVDEYVIYNYGRRIVDMTDKYLWANWGNSGTLAFEDEYFIVESLSTSTSTANYSGGIGVTNTIDLTPFKKLMVETDLGTFALDVDALSGKYYVSVLYRHNINIGTDISLVVATSITSSSPTKISTIVKGALATTQAVKVYKMWLTYI